jgi:hypothetical protein
MLATQPPLITDADLVRAARTPGRWHTCEELSRLTGLSVPRVRAACIAMHRQGYECHPHIRYGCRVYQDGDSRCPVCRSQYVDHYTMYRCRRCEREWERFEDAEECCEEGVD